jgi:hypothetical protein
LIETTNPVSLHFHFFKILSFSGSYAIINIHLHSDRIFFITKTRKGGEAIRPGSQKAFKLPSILAFELAFRDEFIFFGSGWFGLDVTKLKRLKMACQSVFSI